MTTNLVLILIILFQIKRIDSLFVSVGDYTNESIPGLNGPECGLSVKPIVYELSFNNKCFQSKYEDTSILVFDNPKIESQINQRIWKGVDVRDAYKSPWVVFIGTSHWWADAGSCTGVLITPHWVLTAAHCYYDLKGKWMTDIVLTMGSNTKKGSHKIDIESKNFYFHPNYVDPYIPKNTISHYDIALIKTSGFFPTTTHDDNYSINTICLPKRDEVNDVYENASFYGYGAFNDNLDIPKYLKEGWVILRPSRACAYHKYFCGDFIGDLYFKGDRPRICLGDSGGPLVQFIPGVENRAVLLGTASGTEPITKPLCSQSEKGNWIPVPKHIDWILKTIKENS